MRKPLFLALLFALGCKLTQDLGGNGGSPVAEDAGPGGSAGSGGAAQVPGPGDGSCSYPWEYVPPELANAQGPDCGGLPGEPLPCGACAGSVPMCRVGHNRGCPGVTPGDPAMAWSPYDAWLCVCESGSWNCKVQLAAAAACPPEALDAGLDAAGP